MTGTMHREENSLHVNVFIDFRLGYESFMATSWQKLNKTKKYYLSMKRSIHVGVLMDVGPEETNVDVTT